MKTETSLRTLKNARRWCASQFSKRYDRSSHASHLACEILREAEKRYDLCTCGDEGFCDETGATGVSYLNTGESYALTLCVETSRYSARFLVASWGDLAERAERERESEES